MQPFEFTAEMRRAHGRPGSGDGVVLAQLDGAAGQPRTLGDLPRADRSSSH